MDAKLRERLVRDVFSHLFETYDHQWRDRKAWEERQSEGLADSIVGEIEAAGYTLSKRIPIEGKVT